jgi:hypothetical protein
MRAALAALDVPRRPAARAIAGASLAPASRWSAWLAALGAVPRADAQRPRRVFVSVDMEGIGGIGTAR